MGAGHKTTIGIVLIATMMVAALPAWAQSVEQLIERFRSECQAQFEHLRGPGQGDVVRAHVRSCVENKFQARARAGASASVVSSKPLRLVEFTPWLVKPARGPSTSKGLVYYVRGFYGKSPDTFRPAPYVLKTLSEAGWDVICAKVPQDVTSPGYDVVANGAAFLRQRLKELKDKGYKRVILAGHSWGGWASLLAAQASEFAGDALLLSTPNTFGQRTSPFSGGPNPNFRMTATQFGPALNPIKVPTLLILPDDDIWDPDPAARGRIAEKHFADAKVPHLILAKPPGFTGHNSAALPVFDYAYGGCIQSFIENPNSDACVVPPLSNSDFRSLVSIDQIANADERQIRSAQALVGKKFVAYAITANVNMAQHYSYDSATQRKHVEFASHKEEAVSFRDSSHCVAGMCSRLIKWDEGYVLEFNAKSGKLNAWWVEDR
jgi:hypothetical protein